MNVRPAGPSDATALAGLHADQIAEGFLAQLGRPFLARLYRRILRTQDAFAFVTIDDDGRVTGFVAVAEHTGHLYRSFLLRDGLQAGLRALPALLRHPARVAETLRHGLDGHRPPGAEILALAVTPPARGRGAGRALVMATLAELRRRGQASAHVVTAIGNRPAQRTYRGCGFRPATTVELHRGTLQEVLVWP